MGLFNIFGGKSAKKTAVNIRIDAEDLIEQGFSCAQIAEQLGTSQETVYAIKEAKRKRTATANKNNDDEEETESIADLKKQLLKVEIKTAIDKAEAERRRLEEEREAEEEEQEEEFVEEAIDSPENAFMSLISKALIKNPAVANTTDLGTQTAQEKEPSDTIAQPKIVAPALNLREDIPRLITAVKMCAVPKETFIPKAIEMTGITTEQAERLFDFIKRKL